LQKEELTNLYILLQEVLQRTGVLFKMDLSISLQKLNKLQSNAISNSPNTRACPTSKDLRPSPCLTPDSLFFPLKMAWVRTKRGCLLTLAYYAFPRLYEFRKRRWNDIDRRKPKNSEKNLSQCHFVHHKSHTD
jgi:hypothetical protein